MVNAMIPCLLWMIPHIEILSVTNDTRILETLHYIHNIFDKALTVEDLAARIFLDKNYFIRLFTKNTGQTPHSYIRSQRLNRAMTLLQKGIPAKNVSEQCGYDSYCAFSRAFKSHYGYPPTF